MKTVVTVIVVLLTLAAFAGPGVAQQKGKQGTKEPATAGTTVKGSKSNTDYGAAAQPGPTKKPDTPKNTTVNTSRSNTF